MKLIGVSPLAVTEKVPAVLSANVVDAAEVNTGAECRHRQGEGLGRRVGVDVSGRDGDRVGPGTPEGRRAGQGAVGAQGHTGWQGPGLAEADRGVARGRDREGPRRVLGERRRRRRGEDGHRRGHRQGEGLGRGVRVGVGRRDGDRVDPRTPGVRCARPACRRRPGRHPRAALPVSLKLIGSVTVRRDGEGARRALGERDRGGRGEHRRRGRHRQGEGLGRGARVGVGRRDGDRVGPGAPEGRRTGQGAVGWPT